MGYDAGITILYRKKATTMKLFLTTTQISSGDLAALSKVPPRTLDALAAGLINRNATRLLEKINGMLAELDFSLRLGELRAIE